MSMNPESLQKLLIEMDNQLNKSRAELSMCEVQLSRVNTNLNLINQTRTSLNRVCKPEETVWKGVGKAFVYTKSEDYLKEITKDEADFLDSKKSLDTKKHYLETTLEKTVENMTRLVKPGN